MMWPFKKNDGLTVVKEESRIRGTFYWYDESMCWYGLQLSKDFETLTALIRYVVDKELLQKSQFSVKTKEVRFRKIEHPEIEVSECEFM